ncbi:hypothetical protein DPMN_011360 [Dreissena polymorpha]|uniref:Uncharacterized protein n=1 Tax=Dreissena polymorpha TaxID=45954 RepID=A0A9D4N4X1_DREPO|nr:hypothetical protein DPMN_011360 [Dreissena polymorpha]
MLQPNNSPSCYTHILTLMLHPHPHATPTSSPSCYTRLLTIMLHPHPYATPTSSCYTHIFTIMLNTHHHLHATTTNLTLMQQPHISPSWYNHITHHHATPTSSP